MTATQTTDPVSFLDEAERQLAAGHFRTALDGLKAGLYEMRAKLGPARWRNFTEHEFPAHPLAKLFPKRPVACDPVPRSGCGLEEAALEEWEAGLPSIRALRARRAEFRKEAAELCHTLRRPRILAVGDQILREPDFHTLAAFGGRPEFVAIDVKAGRPGADVELGRFDFIYAAHVYDELEQRAAQRLTARLTGMLKPYGRLLVANTVSLGDEAAYLEACRQWWPVCRDANMMARLAEGTGNNLLGQMAFTDNGGHTVYLEVTR